ncbi:MAG: NAD(P)/FAD-dependent oxidoreductase [Dehalococcoidia bacterium]
MAFDVIVVGARCAGSPVGMLLARKGYKVLIVDRGTFPSGTLSTHAFAGDACAALDRWGLLDRVLATDIKHCKGLQMHVDGRLYEMPIGGPYPLIAPMRTVLDKILVDAAREGGAEVREGCSVQEILKDDTGRVTGIRARLEDGTEVTELATVVVGADGRNSFVAKAVGAEEYNTLPARQIAYYSYWSGFEGAEYIEFHFRTGEGAAMVFPTNDGLVVMGGGWPFAEFERVRQDPEANVLAQIARFPAVAERAKNCKREDRIWGWSGYTSYYRKPFGPGWALVGDAGYLKDPTLGQGINDAFVHAEYLADALDAGLSGRQPAEEALQAYQTRRDTETGPIYALNDLMSQGPTQQLLEFLITAAAQMQAPAAPAPA